MPLLKNDIHFKLKNEDKVIIQVAGFREQKDQVTLIKALKHLSLNIKLILVGDGTLKKSCENLVRVLNLEDRVFFLGIRSDIPQLLKSVDIIVLSTKYEGISLSSIEGMASGKPFVASDVPGLRNIVTNAGLLFKQGDDKALATTISKLLNDEKLYNEISKRCQERAVHYDINNLINKHITLYTKFK